jgi:hypothetical protein
MVRNASSHVVTDGGRAGLETRSRSEAEAELASQQLAPSDRNPEVLVKESAGRSLVGSATNR